MRTGRMARTHSRLLLSQDHDVQEDKIFLLSLLMAEMGVHSVAYAFPHVHIITTAVDKGVNEEFHIIPGIGTCISSKPRLAQLGPRRGQREGAWQASA